MHTITTDLPCAEVGATRKAYATPPPPHIDWLISEPFTPQDHHTWKRYGAAVAGELFLYRLTTAQRHVLYVGITWHPAARFSQHRRTKDWWGDVVNLDLWRGPEADVRAWESRVIKTQDPLHNIAQRVG